MQTPSYHVLFQPLELPCGVVLNNRLVKSAMSDSLGDGRGNPTDTQIRLYERWASDAMAALIVGEVQCIPDYPEKPGNLVLHPDCDTQRFQQLARRGSSTNTHLWAQLSHAGALSYSPISNPKGPSELNFPELTCAALSLEEIQTLPNEFARAALLAQELGFGGVQIHAAHGFLVSQFLSPLFNKRNDAYGGAIASRMRLLLEVVEAVSNVVDSSFVVAVKLNSTDQIEGGLTQKDSLEVISALNDTEVDLIEISGGTYFPGVKPASDSAGVGPYFIDFASLARKRTDKPLMVTGGFKTRQQAVNAIASGNVDAVGIARGMVLDTQLPMNWNTDTANDPRFPQFSSPPDGGVTAWYTMQLTEIGEDREQEGAPDSNKALKDYESRDNDRVALWLNEFQ